MDVKDSKDLLRLIRNTRIGDCWLKANIARFTLEEGEIRPEPVKTKAKQPVENNGRKEDSHPAVNSSFFNGSRSFSDTLLGRQNSALKGKTVVIDNNVNAFQDLHGKAVVARFNNLEAFKSVHLILNDLCPGSGKIQYLGGLSVLISFEDEALAAMVYEEAKKDVGNFASVDVWVGQTFCFERLAWIKMMGLPLHLVSTSVIDEIGNAFGKIVHRPPRSDNDEVLSYDVIGVLVGEGKPIAEEVTVVWKERKYGVWVSEELGTWVPEYYKLPCDSSEPENENAQNEDVDVETGNVDVQMVSPGKDQSPIMETPVADFSLHSEEGINVVINSPIIMENIAAVNVTDPNTLLEADVDNFIPGNVFDFENNIPNIDCGDSGFVLNKRKKKGVVEVMGRPNPTYSSSLEKTKIGKKAKNVDDMFGLDQLLGSKGDGHQEDKSALLACNELDLNTPPCVRSDRPSFQEVPSCSFVQGKEVEETISLGERLGVNLVNAQDMIRESINVEGLQGVHK